jgi:hypothetical protein
MITSPDQSPGDMESTETTDTHLATTGSRTPIITAVAVILLVAALSLLAFSIRNSRAESSLFPLLPTFTPLAQTVSIEATSIGFAELNADPALHRDKRIQVTGAFTPVEPATCLDHNGPPIRWSLVADELQLNAIGFEDVLNQVSPGIELTVTGIWRVYQGPVGCGKEPPDETVWYLQVDRIVEPNPLVGSGGPALTVVAGTQQSGQTLLDNDPTSTPGLTVTPTVESLGTVPITAGTTVSTPPLTVTATLTLPATTPLPGLSPTSSVTPTPSPTTGAGTPPATTGTPGGTTTPGLPTGTPSGTGYPQPTPYP